MFRLLLVIAAKHFLLRLTCAESIASHPQWTAVDATDARRLAIDSAHVATVQTALERTRQAGQPSGSNARDLQPRFDVHSAESDDKPP